MKLTNHLRTHLGLLAFLITSFLVSGSLFAQEAAEAVEPAATEAALNTFRIDNLWILIAAFLVFLMHLGFSTLEAGLTQEKNTVNILFKNVFIISIGLVTYYFIGFNTHYPTATNPDFNGFLSFGGMAMPEADGQSIAYGNYTYWTDFLFQAMFAATAATIVSGAVAERVKLGSFMIFATLLVAIAYPIAGSWHWGTGFLSKLGGEGGTPFYDFAGSTVVHAFGGFAALACVLVLGPRKGKYTKNGIKPIIGSNMPLATIGVFLLWLGWFGFNGGSVLNADPAAVSLVCVTTSLAAAGGALAAILISWVFLKKPDLSMALNGILAGLVGITAGADIIPPPMAMLTGFLAGILVVFAIIGLDKIKIDDPVGAISVHGVCGIWGTLACAVFGGQSYVSQLTGIAAVCAFAFIFSFVVFTILKVTLGVRVDEETEINGLDIAEHGAPAYSHTPMA